MKKSVLKSNVYACFVCVKFFVLKNRELKCIHTSAVEVPVFEAGWSVPASSSYALWPKLFRYHSRVLSKKVQASVCYYECETFDTVDEVLDEGLPILHMPESFLKRHRLFVVD